MARTWDELQECLTEVMADLAWQHFVIVEFDAGLETVSPYAQAAREPNGFYCEVVSEYFLPRDAWPILTAQLLDRGWTPPQGPEQNWFRPLDDDPAAATDALLEGLRVGRVCRDPARIAWRVGRFPPGPDGGEPLPLPASLLRRAA